MQRNNVEIQAYDSVICGYFLLLLLFLSLKEKDFTKQFKKWLYNFDLKYGWSN